MSLIAIRRKNWLLIGNKQAYPKAVAIFSVYSVVESRRKLGARLRIKPASLVYIFSRIHRPREKV